MIDLRKLRPAWRAPVAVLLLASMSVVQDATASVPRSSPVAKAPADERISGNFIYEGQVYPYVSFAPAKRPAHPALLVNMHGCAGTAEGQEEYTQTSILARQKGFIVLYPDSLTNKALDSCWRAVTTPALESRTTGDAPALAALTREIAAKYTVDPQRIYATGHSGGAFQAAMLAPIFSDVFAATALHSGAGYGHGLPGCFGVHRRTDSPQTMAQKMVAVQGERPRVLPTMVLHGTSDLNIHYECGLESAAASRMATNIVLARQGSKKRLTTTPTRTITTTKDSDLGKLWQEQSWTLPGDACPATVLLTVYGLGHRWSGAPEENADPEGDGGGPSATKMIWDFLSHIRKTATGFTCVSPAR